MKLLILLLVLSVLLSVSHAGFIVMEKALSSPVFNRVDFPTNIDKSQQQHEIIIALKQRNLGKFSNDSIYVIYSLYKSSYHPDVLDKYLLEVATPKSEKYGKYLTRNEVAILTSNQESSAAVKDYLRKIGAEIIRETRYGDYITAKASIAVWEKAFNTEFHQFKHVDDKVDPIFRSMEYSLEEELVQHVQAVFQTTQFPTIAAPRLPMKKVDKPGTTGKKQRELRTDILSAS